MTLPRLKPQIPSLGDALFANVSIPIWILDLSALAAKLLTRERTASYPQPEALRAALLEAPVVLAVNPAAVAYHGAQSERHLLDSLGKIFLPETMDSVADALTALRSEAHSEAEISLGHLLGVRARARARFDCIARERERMTVSMSLLPLARHSNLLEVLPDLLFEINASGICVDFAGPPDDQLFDSRDFLGKSITEALPPDVAHRMLAALQRLKEQGGTERLEYALSMADGLHWFEARMVAVPFGGASAYVRDITDRKCAEWRLRESQSELDARVRERTRELEHANRELEAFSYSVAHDLRAPLRAIAGFSELIIDRAQCGIDKENVHYFERILAASAQMDRLIDDLLRLSHVSRTDLERANVDWSAMVNDIVRRTRDAQPQRDTRITVQPGIRVRGDIGLLRIALENLFGNAWKFTSAKPFTEIEIGAQEHDGKVTCFIRDNGAGFDMRYAEQLFGAFQRFHAHGEFEGTGIGLAIAHRIIERHGGRLWAEAEVDKGATFYFQIDAATDADGRILSDGAD